MFSANGDLPSMSKDKISTLFETDAKKKEYRFNIPRTFDCSFLIIQLKDTIKCDKKELLLKFSKIANSVQRFIRNLLLCQTQLNVAEMTKKSSYIIIPVFS